MQPGHEADSVEAAYFAELRNACLANNPKAAIEHLTAWLGAFCEQVQSRTVDEMASELVDDELARQIQGLREALNSDPMNWSGEALFLGVDRARRKFLEARGLFG